MQHRTDYKSAVNHLRSIETVVKNANEKIKWFDSLPYQQRQEFTKNYFGRKGVTMSDCDKILLYNKIHNC